jgi:hypothetical protein
LANHYVSGSSGGGGGGGTVTPVTPVNPNAGCAAVPANTWVVDGSVGASGAGNSWTTAKKTIPEALIAASAGDQIWVRGATGTGLTYSVPATLALIAGVHLRGGFNCGETQASQASPKTNKTILDGGSANVVLSATNLATLTEISGLTIQNSNSTAGGAGIRIDNSRVDLSESIIQNNTSTVQGGGVFITGNVEVNIDRSIFISNTATAGGAIYDETGTGIVRVRNTILRNNEATSGNGAAIAVAANGATNNNFYAVNSVFFGNNSANGSGGGLAVLGQFDPVNGNNSAEGIVRNSIFWGNTAGDDGKHMFVYGASSVLTYDNNRFEGIDDPGDLKAGNFPADPIGGTLTENGNNTAIPNPFPNNGANPNGIDGVPGTADDGLKPTAATPGADATADGVTVDILGITRNNWHIGAFE